MSFNRKELKVISSAKKKQNPFAKDRIYDPKGQWKFPGQVTRVPGSNMTMVGVPYPVLGIGSTGQQQMMYPGGQYNFPGSTYVDELPMFQTQGEVKEPTLEERYAATMDWLNTNPYADMPNWNKLKEVNTKMYPNLNKAGRLQVPVAGVYADPHDPNNPNKGFQYQKVDMPADYIGLDVYTINGKPMVVDKDFNAQYLKTYQKPSLGRDEVFHVYGQGLPYNPSLQEVYKERYPQMFPDQTITAEMKFGGMKKFQGDQGSSEVTWDDQFDAWAQAYEGRKAAEAAKLAEEQRIAGLASNLSNVVNRIAESGNPGQFLVDKSPTSGGNFCNAYTNTCYNLAGYTTAEDIRMEGYFGEGKDKFIPAGSKHPQIPGNVAQQPWLDEQGWYQIPLSEAKPGDMIKGQTWAKALSHQLRDDLTEEEYQELLKKSPKWITGHSIIFLGYDDDGNPITAQSHGEPHDFGIESMDKGYYNWTDQPGARLPINADALRNFKDPNASKYIAYTYKGRIPVLEEDIEKYTKAERIANEILDKMPTPKAALKPLAPLPASTPATDIQRPITMKDIQRIADFGTRAMKSGGEYMDLELTDEQIKQYKDGGFVVEDLPTFQEEGEVRTQGGYEYKKEGDKYLTRKAGTQNWIEATGKPLANIKYRVYGEGEDPQSAAEKDAELIGRMRDIFRDDEMFWSADIDNLSPEMQSVHRYGVGLMRGEEHDPNSKEGKQFEKYANRLASPEAWMKLMPETMGKVFDPTNDPNKFKSIKKGWGKNTPAQIEAGQARTKSFGTPDQRVVDFATEQDQYMKDIYANAEARGIQQDELRKEQAIQQREQTKMETGFDPYTGEAVPQWQQAGYSNPDDFYYDMQDSGYQLIADASGLSTVAELTGAAPAMRIAAGEGDVWDYVGLIPAVGLAGKIPRVARTGKKVWDIGKKTYKTADKVMSWNPTKLGAHRYTKPLSLNTAASAYSAYHMPEAVGNVVEDPTDWRNWVDVGLTGLGASPIAAGTIRGARAIPQVRYAPQGFRNVLSGDAKFKDLFINEPIVNFNTPEALATYQTRAAAGQLSPTSNRWYQSLRNPDLAEYQTSMAHIIPGTRASQASRQVGNLPMDKVGVLAKERSLAPWDDAPAEWFTKMGVTAEEKPILESLIKNPSGYWKDPNYTDRMKDLMKAFPDNPYEYISPSYPSAASFAPITPQQVQGLGNIWPNVAGEFGKGFYGTEHFLNAPAIGKIGARSNPIYLGERVHSLESGVVGEHKDGGSYVELELDDDQIKAYQDGGFTVEEVPEINLHLPKMGYQPKNVNPFMFSDVFPIGEDMNALLLGAGVNAMFNTPAKGLRAGFDLTATNMTGFQNGKMIFNEPKINPPSIKLHYTLPNKKR